MAPRPLFCAIIIFALISIPACLVNAQSVFERLVMPGPLIAGHAKLESNCGNCHEPFSRSAQSPLCLACHKEVASDRQAKRGFHGLRPDASKADCRTCHTEHKGRDADIIQLDRQTFNHAFTRFELRGRHKSAPCEGCHRAGEKFRSASQQCVDCHKSADPHRGQLGVRCEGCHQEEAWRRVKPFDHSKTRFSLVGAHAKVACSSCHAGERYKGLETGCNSCHGIQDVHAGRLGPKCETCHSPSSWRTVRFDHGKSTRFALLGAHAKAKCVSCHHDNSYRDKPSMACVGCHRKDDAHKGQLGTNCAQCHNETGWRRKVAFDHDLTRFPLVGRHATITCEECHRSASFKDASRACAGCHQDTLHNGRLGSNCSLCHNPTAWTAWRFDHDRQTKFALTGAHRELQCHGCHRNKVSDRLVLDRTCFGCHAADDAHQGSFGRSCEKCHTTTSFRQGNSGR